MNAEQDELLSALLKALNRAQRRSQLAAAIRQACGVQAIEDEVVASCH